MKHFVMSDIHGMGELFDEVMDFLSDFDEYQLIFLGDACDRGPDGYRIMRELLANPNVVYLKGNHEDMFVKAARQVMAMAMDENLSILELIKCYGGVEELMRFSGEDSRLYIQNGGLPTFREWIKDGARKSFVTEIANLPIYHCLNDRIDMFHAGSNTNTLATMDEEEMLWDRHHFCDKWMYGEGDRLLIHGHTPVEHIYYYIEEEVPRIWQPMRYSENKICMDTAAFMTNTIGLYYVENDCFVMFSPKEQLPTF
mgnify:CR=1 FL=1